MDNLDKILDDMMAIKDRTFTIEELDSFINRIKAIDIEKENNKDE